MIAVGRKNHYYHGDSNRLDAQNVWSYCRIYGRAFYTMCSLSNRHIFCPSLIVHSNSCSLWCWLHCQHVGEGIQESWWVIPLAEHTVIWLLNSGTAAGCSTNGRSNQAKWDRNSPLIKPRTRWEYEQKEMKERKVRDYNFFFFEKQETKQRSAIANVQRRKWHPTT